MNMFRKGPQIKLSALRAPDALIDLYYDLRDRHLLPLVALLAVAIVAVPIALSQSSGSPSSGASTNVALALPSQVPNHSGELVVAKSTPGLRVYHRRLTHLRAKDPFKQQYTETESTSASGSSGAGSSGGGESSPSSAPQQVPSTTTSPGTGSQTAPARSHLIYFSYAIDVRTVSGSSGSSSATKSKPTVRRNLPELTVLPSRSIPAAIFMGVSKDGDKALLLLSSQVDSIFGEGRCLLGSTSCQLLALEPGNPETFVYGPQGRTFKIEILKVHFVVTKRLHRAPLRASGKTP